MVETAEKGQEASRKNSHTTESQHLHAVLATKVGMGEDDLYRGGELCPRGLGANVFFAVEYLTVRCKVTYKCVDSDVIRARQPCVFPFPLLI